MSEVWPASDFAARLAERPRLVILFEGARCASSRAFRAAFEAVEIEAAVPFARATLTARDVRRRDHRIAVTPTVVYYEHGEELERVEAAAGGGLREGDLERFLEAVDALEEEPRVPRRFIARRS